MACPRLVVIGASAGGVEAVRRVLGGLERDFPAAVLIVIHTASDGTNMLPSVLGRSTPLPVTVARDGDRLVPGRVYLPPTDCHLMVNRDRIALTRGPRQHGFRPAVDPLFISAAGSCRSNVIGVVLSGALGDGTLGLMAIKRSGGMAVVQNPEEAAFPSMPLTALKSVEVDYVLPAADIGPRLVELSARPARRRLDLRPPAPAAGAVAGNGRGRGKAAMKGSTDVRGELTALVCPSCGGALWESDKEGVDEYLCHVGHRFSPEALQTLQLDQLDHALWGAVRALNEDSILRKRMAERAGERGMRALAREWQAQARASEASAAELRRLIERIEPPAMTDQLSVAPRQRTKKGGTRKRAARKAGRR